MVGAFLSGLEVGKKVRWIQLGILLDPREGGGWDGLRVREEITERRKQKAMSRRRGYLMRKPSRTAVIPWPIVICKGI